MAVAAVPVEVVTVKTKAVESPLSYAPMEKPSDLSSQRGAAAASAGLHWKFEFPLTTRCQISCSAEGDHKQMAITERKPFSTFSWLLQCDLPRPKEEVVDLLSTDEWRHRRVTVDRLSDAEFVSSQCASFSFT
ncbi:Hypothetical predicted protein [Olea europaea subsp. europaea]|uniref:Uncharacterized protein n=1 Tax=Olea europaea subsp. europaea TaxID=158383 RepID=A0A8S0SHE3_OLEEU|nr:Hypothetical predicted protein [Olea europaea subsp. europaea]